MRSIITAGLAAALLCFAGHAMSQVRVKGYFKKDGTYVAPHVRSSPNSTPTDNYSTKGNFNPYTGENGTVDPYRVPQQFPAFVVPRTVSPQYIAPPQPSPSSRPYAAPPQGLVRAVEVWKCVAANGFITYLAYPRSGCDQLVVAVPVVGPAPVAPVATHSRMFSGYRCTSDCSGHEAGWQWAENQGIEDPGDCGGRSQSFIEGCIAYAEERQAEMVEEGECNDSDDDAVCD